MSARKRVTREGEHAIGSQDECIEGMQRHLDAEIARKRAAHTVANARIEIARAIAALSEARTALAIASTEAAFEGNVTVTDAIHVIADARAQLRLTDTALGTVTL